MISMSKSLLSKIHEILDHKQKTEQAEQVARDYVQLSQQINGRIKHFIKLIREGNYYAAVDVARLEPPLTTQIERIRFPREREWLQFLKDSGLPTFEGFNDNEFKKVKEICADSSYLQPKGYRDYRKAILLKDKNAAIRALRKLSEDYPKDSNAKQELERLEHEVFEEITRRLTLLLKREKTQAIVEEVKDVLDQPWSISLGSETWEACLNLYKKHTRKQEAEQMLQLLSQLKVIRRVGEWKDAGNAIGKLAELKAGDAFQEIDRQLQADIEDMLEWFRECEAEAEELERLNEEMRQFLSRIEPLALEQSIESISKREIRQYRKDLQQEWSVYQDRLPQAAEKALYQYNRADSLLDRALGGEARTKRGFPFLSLFGSLAVISLALLLFLNHKREGDIAAKVLVPFKQENLLATESAIKDWDTYIDRYLSGYNPFRNYGAHKRMRDVRQWIQDAHTRERKILDLLDKIDSELNQSPDAGQLKRIQLNMEIVRDLYEKLPKTGNTDALNSINSLSKKVQTVHRQQITRMKDEIVSGLVDLESLTHKYFPTRKTDFQNTRTEILDARDLISKLQLKFRQNFDEPDFANLKQRFDKDVAVIDRFEESYDRLTEIRELLKECHLLPQYLLYLEEISDLPFPKHPMVIHAQTILREKGKFRSLVQQLLLPGNPIAWEQFQSIKDSDIPLVPKTGNPRENRIFEDLINEYSLKSIYRYRIVEYKDRERLPGSRIIHSLGEAKARNDIFQTSGRLIQTVDQFDETAFERDQPFYEKVYICRTNADGTPIDGEYLEMEELCPESEFYRDLAMLCNYDTGRRRIQRSLLEVLDEVKINQHLSPLFKAYITQELFDVMMVRPYDWGLNFSPSVQFEYRDLLKIKGILTPYDWLRSSSKARLLEALTIYYENIGTDSYHTQALLGYQLFAEISSQQVYYGGYVDTEGTFHILDATPKDHRLFGMLEDGTFRVIRRPVSGENPATGETIAPYTPILYLGETTDTILNRIKANSGIDLRDEKYRPHLPPMFL